MSIQNQSDRPNAPCTDDNISRAIEEVEESPGTFQHVPLLDGIVLETEVEVFPGIRLVPFPPSLGKKGTEIPRYISKWTSTVGIDYFFSQNTTRN